MSGIIGACALAAMVAKRVLERVAGARGRDRGQGLAEYALMLALVAVVVIGALTFTGASVSDALDGIGDSLGAIAGRPKPAPLLSDT